MKNEKLDQNKEHNSQKHLNQYKLQGMTNKAYRPSLSLANWEVYCMTFWNSSPPNYCENYLTVLDGPKNQVTTKYR